MGTIEEIADAIGYRPKKCWECPFYDRWCLLYHRTTEDESKPDYCRVEEVRITFRR